MPMIFSTADLITFTSCGTTDEMIAQWNEELDADTVTNLTDEEQVAVRTLFANTIFFVNSMKNAIGENRLLDMSNKFY